MAPPVRAPPPCAACVGSVPGHVCVEALFQGLPRLWCEAPPPLGSAVPSVGSGPALAVLASSRRVLSPRVRPSPSLPSRPPAVAAPSLPGFTGPCRGCRPPRWLKQWLGRGGCLQSARRGAIGQSGVARVAIGSVFFVSRRVRSDRLVRSQHQLECKTAARGSASSSRPRSHS